MDEKKKTISGLNSRACISFTAKRKCYNNPLPANFFGNPGQSFASGCDIFPALIFTFY